MWYERGTDQRRRSLLIERLAVGERRQRIAPMGNGSLDSRQLKEARRAARCGDDAKCVDLRDDRVRQLVLRRRKGSLSWLYKTRERTIKIGCGHAIELGDARKEARRIAGDEDAKIAERERRREEHESMPFGELLDRYIAYRSKTRLTGQSVKKPKKNTLKDIRAAFSRRAVLALRDRPVATLRLADLEALRDDVRHADPAPFMPSLIS